MHKEESEKNFLRNQKEKKKEQIDQPTPQITKEKQIRIAEFLQGKTNPMKKS